MTAPDGFVLAGGAGRRMGVDKARVPFPGRRPMALEVADRLRAVCGVVRLVRRSAPDPLPWPGISVILDRAPPDDPHPLWGIAAALRASSTPIAVIAPCDTPFLDPDALRALIAHPGGAVAHCEGRPWPLVAALPTSLADRAEALARAGAGVHALVAGCAAVPFPADALRDLDTWSEAGRPGPVRSLLDRLSWLDPAARARVAAGERIRLAHRGVIDPDATIADPSEEG